MSIASELGNTRSRTLLLTPEGEIDLSDVTAAWFHQTSIGYSIPELDDPRHRELAVGTSLVTLQGVLASLDAFLVDPFSHAEFKQVQLRAAHEAGLEIPRTLITSDPESVRRFAAAVGDLVTKTPGTNLRLYDARGHADAQMYTQRLRAEDLADLEGLRLCPMIFQERLEKRVELRIVVVGYDIYATSIDPSSWERGRDEGAVDWRLAHEFDYARVTYVLPEDVRAGLLRLMGVLGLNYAAADMIVTPDGRHVLLEINPNGGGFEPLHQHGLPIAESMAKLLLGMAPRRPVARAHVFPRGAGGGT